MNAVKTQSWNSSEYQNLKLSLQREINPKAPLERCISLHNFGYRCCISYHPKSKHPFLSFLGVICLPSHDNQHPFWPINPCNDPRFILRSSSTHVWAVGTNYGRIIATPRWNSGSGGYDLATTAYMWVCKSPFHRAVEINCVNSDGLISIRTIEDPSFRQHIPGFPPSF